MSCWAAMVWTLLEIFLCYAVTILQSLFSNWGSCVNIFAPGTGISSATHNSNSNFVGKSGTSMATPMTAGVVALYLKVVMGPLIPRGLVF